MVSSKKEIIDEINKPFKYSKKDLSDDIRYVINPSYPKDALVFEITGKHANSRFANGYTKSRLEIGENVSFRFIFIRKDLIEILGKDKFTVKEAKEIEYNAALTLSLFQKSIVVKDYICDNLNVNIKDVLKSSYDRLLEMGSIDYLNIDLLIKIFDVDFSLGSRGWELICETIKQNLNFDYNEMFNLYCDYLKLLLSIIEEQVN